MGAASLLVSTFALNAAWQVVAIVVAAALADRLLRKASARVRHGLWRAAFVLAVALPVVATVPRHPVAPERDAPPVALPVDLSPVASTVPATAGGRFTIPVPGVAGLLATALLVLALGVRGARLVGSLRAAGRWRRAAVPVGSARLRELMRECETALGMPPVPVLTLGGLEGPITLGVLRPVILVPPSFVEEHEDDALRSALGHELAHIRRRDYALNLLTEVTLLPLAWHPAVRLLRRRLDETREMACDELAVERVIEPRRYARSLVAVAASSRRLAPAPALGVNDGDILQERIRHLLDRRGRPLGPPRLGLAAGALLLVVTSLSASLAVIEADPLPATAQSEWRAQMSHLVGTVLLAVAMSGNEDFVAKGVEALRKGDLPAATANVEKAIAANPRDRDALYTLGVIRWQETYQALGEAKKAGGVTPAQRDRLKKTVALGHDALERALAVDPEFSYAVAYDSLLYRLDADLATSPAESQAHVAKADALLAKMKAMPSARNSTTGSSVVPPPPPPPPPPAKK